MSLLVLDCLARQSPNHRRAQGHRLTTDQLVSLARRSLGRLHTAALLFRLAEQGKFHSRSVETHHLFSLLLRAFCVAFTYGLKSGWNDWQGTTSDYIPL